MRSTSARPQNQDEWPTIPELEPTKPTPREKKPRLPTDDHDAATLEEGFTNKLAAMAADIRHTAAGRTCGDCKSLRDGWCSTQTNMSGDNLMVLHPYAVACSSFEVRP